jgi:hypothetical protein
MIDVTATAPLISFFHSSYLQSSLYYKRCVAIKYAIGGHPRTEQSVIRAPS